MKRLILSLGIVLAVLPASAPGFAATCRHNVARGESLSGIAARYDTTVAEIRAANPGVGLDPLLVGQTISVPCDNQSSRPSTSATPQPRGEWRLVRASTTARCVTVLRVGRTTLYAPPGWCYTY